MQGGARGAVEVREELAGESAQVVQVQAGVRRAHRVEGPRDEAQAAAERLLALRPLEAQPDAEAASRRLHGEHVRVKVAFAPAAGRRRRSRSPGRRPRRVGDEQEAPGVDGGDQLDGRGDLQVREAPDLALQPHAGVVVGAVAGRPDEERPWPGSLASPLARPGRAPGARIPRRRDETNPTQPLAGTQGRSWRALGAAGRPAPGFFARLRRAVGLLLSREVAVLMNAIAFNVLLCLFPLLLVLVAAAQRLSPGSGTAQVLRLLLAELIPFGGETIAASLRQMTRLARGFEVLSLVLVVWGSSGVFMPVEMALDRVWGGAGPRSFWKSRLLAFALTVAGGALALLSVALTLLVRGFGRELAPVVDSAAKAAALVLSWALFLLVYRLVPRPASTWVSPRGPPCGPRCCGRPRSTPWSGTWGGCSSRRSTARWRSRCPSCSGPTSRASSWSSGPRWRPGAPRRRIPGPSAPSARGGRAAGGGRG